MKTSRFTDSRTIAILEEAEADKSVPALFREQGMSATSFYKWRAEFGSMDTSLMAWMK